MAQAGAGSAGCGLWHRALAGVGVDFLAAAGGSSRDAALSVHAHNSALHPLVAGAAQRKFESMAFGAHG